MLPHTAVLFLSFCLACSSALDVREADDGQCVIEYVTVYANGPAAGTGSTASPSTIPMSTTYHIPTHMPVPLKQASPSVGAQGSDEGSSSAASTTGIASSSGSNTAAAETTSGTTSSTQSSAAPSSSASSTADAKSNITPGGKKAGISGYVNIAMKADWSQFTPYISWYSDYTPNPPDSGDVKGIGMLWGSGSQGPDDSSRLATFKSVITPNPPAYMMGFYEPDWTPPDSSAISPPDAASLWSSLLAPLATSPAHTLLGSPSLAKQLDETWLTPFFNTPEKPAWDFTCIHANKNSSAGVQADVEYYYSKYGKPVWVAEFSCMNDEEWTACDDPQGFIRETVKYLEGEEKVVAYGYSNGDGLPEEWKLFDQQGGITANGKVYLEALRG